MPTNSDDTQLITLLLVIIGAVFIFPLFFIGFGMMGFGPMMSGMWGGHMWGDGTIPGWMFIVGILMQLLFLAALVGGGYLVYRAVTGGASDSDQALEELRLAYARGELTDEEYEQRREALERDT
ncbi:MULTISPECIES: SHOCT domain-containing protein [unclassified Halobacterium]|uniref:SHOCT domain-containing protein n=1 Tax=unclassified Halobacterium TaxID=2668073 RepID=UPI001E3E4155|nr:MULTISPECIES: SHOCT domain-containing protein [unclassified Halobacterium]MCD2200710.1 SHOCT domain-containing protein [Halobacterium sp. KA-4]MCD2203978.1 SHOCT domain-containing protein [Halobacterium sp. KA-6]